MTEPNVYGLTMMGNGVAEKGTALLKVFWTGLTAEEKHAIGGAAQLESWKRTAELSDTPKIWGPLDHAMEAAKSGLDVYKAFWEGLTPEERKLIGPLAHADYKVVAEEATINLSSREPGEEG